MIPFCLLLASSLFGLPTASNHEKPPVVSLSSLSGAEESKPNILFITIDDLNTDIGAMGGPILTPHIDQLAGESVLFMDAHATSPVCGPSRASFLTGLFPDTLDYYNHSGGANFRDTPVGRKAVTLPQYLAQHGYKTANAGKIFHSQPGDGKQPREHSDPQSWQYQFMNEHGVPHDRNRPISQFWHKGKLGAGHWPGRSWDWQSINIADEATGDWQNADFGARYLQKDHDKPFFLAVGIFRPHTPFTAPEKYFDLYPLDAIELPLVLPNDKDDVGPIGREWATKADLHKWITHFDQWKVALQAYYASSSFADACVGHLLDALDASEYADNTIVVLLSDHGFHLGQKEHWAKFTFWDQASRVPFLIRLPRGPSGTAETTVSLIDIYPTLLELAGLPPYKPLEGQSLTSLLQSPETDEAREAHLMFQEAGHEAVINDDWRYIRYNDGFEELYDRQNDPHDWFNLAGNPEYKRVLEDFRAKLRTDV